MPLRITPTLLATNAHGYNNRVMVYAHRRARTRYLPPTRGHAPSPTLNKDPSEYAHTWDPRHGIDWHNRLRRRGHYRHWPWARWTDDPVRHHQDTTHRRTLSAAAAATNEGMPEWDYYSEVGQDYRVPLHFPLHFAGRFIHQYTARVWSRATIEAQLQSLSEKTGLRTIADAAQRPQELLAWADAHRSDFPFGLVQHTLLVTRDMARLASRKEFRQVQHSRGILRTPDMVRYYALPHLRSGPAMPVKHAQPSGVYPWGRYSRMLGHTNIHPLQRPDSLYLDKMYPN